MHGFNLVDGIVAVVILLSAILAYSRGFVREAMAIAGWVGAAVLAYIFAPSVEPLVKEVPVLNKFLADSCELSMIAAFAAVFAVGLVVVSLFTPLFSTVVQRSVLAGLDRGLGFLFGVARGLVLVAVGFMVYDKAMATDSFPMVNASRSHDIFASFQTQLETAVPTNVPNWIVGRYNQLTSSCGPATGGAAAGSGAALSTPGVTKPAAMPGSSSDATISAGTISGTATTSP